MRKGRHEQRGAEGTRLLHPTPPGLKYTLRCNYFGWLRSLVAGFVYGRPTSLAVDRCPPPFSRFALISTIRAKLEDRRRCEVTRRVEQRDSIHRAGTRGPDPSRVR